MPKQKNRKKEKKRKRKRQKEKKEKINKKNPPTYDLQNCLTKFVVKFVQSPKGHKL
jgi:hypothetical protein